MTEVQPTANSAAANLAREIKRRREIAGWSQRELAERVGYTRQHVSLAERVGHNLPSQTAVDAFDAALRADGALRELRKQAKAEQRARRASLVGAPIKGDPAHLSISPRACQDRDNSEPEGKAHEDLGEGAIFVPLSRRDLLQGAGVISGAVIISTMAADFGGVGEVKPASYFRTVRRTLIDSDNCFGPSEAIPRAERHVAILGHLCEEARGSDRVELLYLRSQFAELAAWLHEDSGNYAIAQYWSDRALDWSHAAGDAELMSIVLVRKIQLGCDMRDAVSATGLGEAVISSKPHRKVAAVASTYLAHGHALSGDMKSSEQCYEDARELIGQADDVCNWGDWLSGSYIDVHQAQSLVELGEHRRAADMFDRALTGLSGGEYHRDLGVYLARSARAHAGAGDVDHAAEVAIQSFEIAAETKSGRAAKELSGLMTQWQSTQSASVDCFRQLMRGGAHQ